MAEGETLVTTGGKLRVLPIIHIAIVGMIAYRRPLFIIVYLPTVASIALDVCLQAVRPENYTLDIIAWQLAYAPLMAWFLGPVYRFVLDLREGTSPDISCRFRRQDIRLVVVLLVLWAIPYLFVQLFLDAQSELSQSIRVFGFTTLLVTAYAYSRLCVAFPAAAKGSIEGPKQLWHLTRSNGLRLFLLQALTLAPFFIFQWLADYFLFPLWDPHQSEILFAFVFSSMLSPFWAIGIVLTASVEALSYHELIGDSDPDVGDRRPSNA